MIRIFVLLACTAVALGSRLSFGERVVGGANAGPGQFPHQISMRRSDNKEHHCGGSIISRRHILTAAHCVFQQNVPDNFFIVTGATYLDQGGEAYAISAAVFHSNWNPQTMENDIAIITTESDIQFHAGAYPIELESSEVPDGSTLILSGWGSTSWPSNGSPNTLQWIYLRSINIDECADAMQPSMIFRKQICTFNRPGEGSCFGDSGGPLVFNGRLAGVVSWGRPCGVGYPDIFTKVSAYYDWIQRYVQGA